jgi:hypothetical protein
MRALRQAGTKLAVGLLPAWTFILLSVFAPDFMAALDDCDRRVGLFGAPLGLLLVVAAQIWMGLGLFALGGWRGRRSTMTAFLAFTLPATLVIGLAPVIYLTVYDLGSS